MKDPKQTKNCCTVGPCRVGYVHLLEKHKFDSDKDGEGKYMATVIIPKSEKRTVAAIEAAIKEAEAIGLTKPKVWGGKRPKKVELPLRDGDDREDGAPEFQDCWYINAKSQRRPLVINTKKEPLTSEEDVYSGMWGMCALQFFAYSTSGNAGVGCAIQGFMKTKDDEPFGGGNGSAKRDLEEFADEFDNEEDEDL